MQNAYQTTMYEQLMQLVKDSETFYFQDFDLDGRTYRIFNYRLSTYTEFLRPSALECRGHMFRVAADGSAELVALPMQKFFNLNENPFTMNLDLSQVDSVDLKADGSLMSTFMHKDELRFKSKGSLFSQQAIDACKFIDQPENLKLKSWLTIAAEQGYTVNLEWCAPHNRIVIGYLKPHLTVLNARHMTNGTYMNDTTLHEYFQEHAIAKVDVQGLDTATFVQSIPAMLEDIEGYVGRIGDLWFKVKTEKYMSLHHAKDSINNPRRLFEAVVDEGVDDLRSLFHTDALAMQQIDEMQEKVTKLYNHMVELIETYYEQNKGLTQKEYAIKGQLPESMDRMYFGLAMNKYSKKIVDYKDFLKKHYAELGFNDTSVDVSA